MLLGLGCVEMKELQLRMDKSRNRELECIRFVVLAWEFDGETQNH